VNERERLQELHLTLEGALEQLTRAHQLALPDAPELSALERSVEELVALRNTVRERLMKVLAKPTLNIIK
jgi:hypothetical protein